jgi:nucleotide-binding universal stress UspA family protein
VGTWFGRCCEQYPVTRRTSEFRVAVATDESSQARAALATVVAVPWPADTHVRAVIATQSRPPYSRSILLTGQDQDADESAARARRTLARRWPSAEAVVVDRTPVEGILHEAERFRADLIAVGWRGHGTARRLLMGSVSRGVVRGARCAVLVVRQRPPRLRRIVIGFDASSNAQRAVELVAKLVAPPDGRVTLITVAEMLTPSSRGPSVAGIRSTLAREIRRINTESSKAATKALNRAAAELDRSGWRTRTRLLTGEPLRELMTAVGDADPQLLVVGARGTSGVRQLLLGSVAEGVLNRSPVPVLLAR